MATRVATGIQSALGRSSPKAMPTASAMASARITANMIIGRVSADRPISPGSSGKWEACALRPRTSHPMKVTAIHSAAPTNQATPCCHHSAAAALRCAPAGTDNAIRNHALSSSAAT